MRKTIALKSLLRAPLRTLLTFLLIAASAFALFSRVTDYAVTTRETKNAQSLYHAVASLDNEVADIMIETKAVQSADGAMNGYGVEYEMEDKPWPTEEELEEFSSLPGVTLADTRYEVAGLVEDYECLLGGADDVLFEGTYNGYLDDTDSSVLEDHVCLKFDDVKVIAGRGEGMENGTSIVLEDVPLGEMYYARSFFTRAFYDSIEKGSRCLVKAINQSPSGKVSGIFFEYDIGPDALRVIDGLPDNYLETDSFARQRGWIEAYNYNVYAYEIVYTADMRAIPKFNDQRLQIVKGRPLTSGDTDGCVVSKSFLKTHQLSVGDKISIQMADRLMPRKKVMEGEDVPEFEKKAELPIVGAYDAADSGADSAYSYSPNTIYVPASLLPVEVPDDYEPRPNDFSVFVEDASDIEEFYGLARQFAERLDLELKFTDRGWLDVKDSFRLGAFTSLLTTVLYIAGAVLASFLAVYLYIGRNKKSYAIMRMLGVPGKSAGNSLLLPFIAVTALAVPIGGSLGLYYAQKTAQKAIADMADSAPLGYVPDAALSVSTIILCFLLELLLVSLFACFFLMKMKRVAPLELLMEGAKQRAVRGMRKEEAYSPAAAPSLTGLNTAKLSVVEKAISRGHYGAVRHVIAYIRHHMRRAVGKTAISLVLTVVMAAGIGTLVLARITYQDAFYALGVKCTASDFIFQSATELSTSSLVKDFYCKDSFGIRIEGVKDNIPMIVTSDPARELGDECVVEYADGFDSSSFEGTAQVCLVGKEIAEKFGISPGDEIGILSDFLYTVLKEQSEDAVSNAYKTYKVIGVASSGDINVAGSIFTGIRSDLTLLFSMDFPVDHCEFTLADNDRLGELEELLKNMEGRSIPYSEKVLYHVDAGGLANIERIRGLLESMFPIAVAAAVLIGLFGPLLIISQSVLEAAFLRILGVTKKRVRCILMLEQIVLSVMGIVLVAGGLALYDPGRFAKGIGTFAACYGLYLLGSVCGAFTAAIQVTRHKVLELLQVKE